jgi:capsular exopolysaccharide synthesis family protein
VQETLHLPVLGVILEHSMGRVGFQVNGNKPLKADDLDAFRIVRANVEFLNVENPPRCVVVTSAVAEEGKSTVAASLAQTAAAAGKRVLLVECDLRRPSLVKRLGLAAEPGLADYLTGRAEPREILQTLRLATPGDDEPLDGVASQPLTCITAGAAVPSPAELLASEKFKSFLAEVREVYDMIVLDCPPLLSVVDALQVAPLADAVVVCIRAGRTTEDQAQAAKAALARVPDRPAGIVVTGVKPRDEAVYGYYAYPARRERARA